MNPRKPSIPSQAEAQSAPDYSVSAVRRRLLQTLAATGSLVAVDSLVPGQWVKPVVEVGYLPAHAQASGIVLSNGSLSLTPGSSCNGGAGNVYTVSFSYNNPFGGVEPGSQVQHSFEFEPSGFSGQFTQLLSAADISGDGFQGTVSYDICQAFGGDSQLATTLRLMDSGGRASQALTFTISKPAGALDDAQAPKAMVSPL